MSADVLTLDFETMTAAQENDVKLNSKCPSGTGHVRFGAMCP